MRKICAICLALAMMLMSCYILDKDLSDAVINTVKPIAYAVIVVSDDNNN